MIKAPPDRVPQIINQGYNVYKPPMKECIKHQANVIKYLIPGDKHLSVLIKEAECKVIIADRRQWEKTCKEFEKSLNEWDPNEVI